MITAAQPATEHHVRKIVPLFSERDLLEWKRFNRDPTWSLIEAVEASPISMTVMEGDMPVAIVGILDTGTLALGWGVFRARPWPSAHAIARLGIKFAKSLPVKRDGIVVTISQDYHQSIKMVTWCARRAIRQDIEVMSI